MESTPIGDLVAAELAAARRREEDWARFGAACEARAEQARFDALQRALRRRRGLAAAGKLLLGLLILAATLASALSAVAAIR